MGTKDWMSNSKELLQPLVDGLFKDESEVKALEAITSYASAKPDLSVEDYLTLLDKVHAQAGERLDRKRAMIGDMLQKCARLGLGKLAENVVQLLSLQKSNEVVAEKSSKEQTEKEESS